MKKSIFIISLLGASAAVFGQDDRQMIGPDVGRIAAKDMTADVTPASLPVLNSYISSDVLSKATGTYGKNLYSVTQVKSASGEDAYQVTLIDNGQSRMAWIGGDGSEIANVFRTPETEAENMAAGMNNMGADSSAVNNNAATSNPNTNPNNNAVTTDVNNTTGNPATTDSTGVNTQTNPMSNQMNPTGNTTDTLNKQMNNNNVKDTTNGSGSGIMNNNNNTSTQTNVGTGTNPTDTNATGTNPASTNSTGTNTNTNTSTNPTGNTGTGTSTGTGTTTPTQGSTTKPKDNQ